MKAEFLYGTSVVTLPADVKNYISRATANDMRVIIALSAGEGASASALARACGITEGEVVTSLAFWRGAGIIRTIDEPAQKLSAEPTDSPAEKIESPRAYQLTGEEIENICASHPDLKDAINECQKIFSKIFTFSESGVIVYLYDHLRLDRDFIVLVCDYCKNNGHTSVRYLEKTALSLFDRGIDDAVKLKEFFESESECRRLENHIRKLYGMGARALTAKERAYIDTWVNVWHVSDELVTAAYERMMNSISEPKIHYENKILKEWYESGITDASQIDEKDPIKTEKKKPTKKKTESDLSFDIDEFFKLAVERGKAKSDSDGGR